MGQGPGLWNAEISAKTRKSGETMRDYPQKQQQMLSPGRTTHPLLPAHHRCSSPRVVASLQAVTHGCIRGWWGCCCRLSGGNIQPLLPPLRGSIQPLLPPLWGSIQPLTRCGGARSCERRGGAASPSPRRPSAAAADATAAGPAPDGLLGPSARGARRGYLSDAGRELVPRVVLPDVELHVRVHRC